MNRCYNKDMRLYLSSFRLGDTSDKLVRLVGNNKRVAVIANACDFRDEGLRNDRVEREFSDLQSIGLEPIEIDLRDYFDNPVNTEDFSGYGAVWLRGGNAFNLRRAMRQSHFDEVITDMLKQDKIVYGGYSAGACVLSPSLHGIELCDNPNEVPGGYQPEIIWEGLNLLSYAIAPHYKSDHPESPMIDRVVEYFIHNKIPYKPLHDGEVITVGLE
jgi:dipeptidase E